MARMIRTDVYLTPEQRQKLAQAAKKQKTGYATLFRRMLDAYFGIETVPVPSIVFKKPISR